MMTRDECVELGYISKAHGIKGEVRVVFDVHDIEEYQHKKAFFLAPKGEPLQRIRVKAFRLQTGKQAIIKFEGINDRNSSESLTSNQLFIPLTELPELPEGEFYYFEIMGFQVQDEVLGELGTIKDYVEAGGQNILFMTYKEKEVLIPANRDFVLRADMEKKVLFTHLPEGLVELYTEEDIDNSSPST